MIKSREISISQDGKIYVKGEYVGFLDDRHVFITVSGNAVKAGEYDHRSEAVAIVLDWLNERR